MIDVRLESRGAEIAFSGEVATLPRSVRWHQSSPHVLVDGSPGWTARARRLIETGATALCVARGFAEDISALEDVSAGIPVLVEHALAPALVPASFGGDDVFIDTVAVDPGGDPETLLMRQILTLEHLGDPIRRFSFVRRSSASWFAVGQSTHNVTVAAHALVGSCAESSERYRLVGRTEETELVRPLPALALPETLRLNSGRVQVTQTSEWQSRRRRLLMLFAAVVRGDAVAPDHVAALRRGQDLLADHAG